MYGKWGLIRMRTYGRYKRFVSVVEGKIQAEKFTNDLLDHLTLKSFGVPDEIIQKIYPLDITYIYSELMNGKELLTTKEVFFRLKRFPCFKQNKDGSITYQPSPKVIEVLQPVIDLNSTNEDQKEVIEMVEKIVKTVNTQKLNLDEKKLRVMKDVLTNFRLLLKKMGFEESKSNNVATLVKDGLTLKFNTDGLTKEGQSTITISMDDVEIQL